MNIKNLSPIILVCVFLTTSGWTSKKNMPFQLQGSVVTFNIKDWKQEKISPESLIKWKLLGKGTVSNTMANQTVLTELDETQGVMLLSPVYYGKNVVVKYKALALTPVSVFVTMLSASDTDKNSLNIPSNYDGSMGIWNGSKRNYFFAFKNAAHAGTPFIKRNAAPVKEIAAPYQDHMVAGVYYDVEVGRFNSKLWLTINGKRIIEMTDTEDLEGGHVAFRLRGLPGFKAACLIKDMAVYTK